MFRSAPVHLILTFSIQGFFSMGTETNLTVGPNSFSTRHTPGEYSRSSTAIEHTIGNSALYKHVTERDNENVEKTERIIDDKLSVRNNTKISVCNNSNDNDNIQYENLQMAIENEKTELSSINTTTKRMLNDISNVAWMFINNPEEKAGHEAIKLSREYLQEAEHFLKEIRKYNTLVNEYNCIFTSLTSKSDTIPDKEQEDVRQYQNIVLLFEHLYGIITDYHRMHEIKEKAKNLTEKYNEFRHINDLKKSIEEEELLKEKIRNMYENVKMTNNFSRTYNLESYFVTEFTKQLLDLNFWELELENKTNELKNLTRYVQGETVRILLHESVQPAIQGIIFTIGFVGNGVMIVIFAREKDIRTATNMMLLNLAVADMLNLIVNIPAFYSYTVSTRWQFGLHLCVAYRFLRQLGISVSIYSIVVLSVQRFIAVTQFGSFRCYRCQIPNKLKSFLSILFVWLIGCTLAVPHTVNTGIYKDNCYAASDEHTLYPKAITLMDLILYCVVPLSFITAFSVLTAYRLKRSIRKLPGEAVGMEKLIETRVIGSNVLIVLAVVSAVSYIPLFVLLFLYAWADLEMHPATHYVVITITYNLLFGNSCFNPVALYIVSRKFRHYFNRYLCCREERELSDNQNQISQTSSLTIETRL